MSGLTYQLSPETLDEIKLRAWNGVPAIDIVQAAIAKELELGHLVTKADVEALITDATTISVTIEPPTVTYDAKANIATITPPAVPPQKPTKK